MHRQMLYFIAVVETNSFFEAGEICHISQSAISQQIKALEEELQVPRSLTARNCITERETPRTVMITVWAFFCRYRS